MSENTHEGHSTKAAQSSLAIPLAIVIAGGLIAASIIFTDGGGTPGKLAAAQPSVQAPSAPSLDSKDAEKLLAIRANDHVIGSRDADLVFIEYSDLECPFCKRFHPTVKQILDVYGKEGSVAFVYRHFPLSIHPKALKEAEAAECAAALGDKDTFWKFLDDLYEITPANNQLDFAELPKIAGRIGVDVAAFNTCLESGKMASRVEEDFSSGVQLGVQGTPHTIIWNKKTGRKIPINGALPFENIKTLIAAAAAPVQN
jgi:protein-disulfide isomerase